MPEVPAAVEEQAVALAVHFGLFFVLSLLAAARFGSSTPWVAVAFCLAAGLSLELLQGVVPGRTVEVADAAANALGAVLAPLLGRPTSGD